MSKLIRDILYLIIEELQDDNKTLFSCILVNKTWCEISIQILWRNPWKYLNNKKASLLLNVIISHFSDESRKKLGLYREHGLYVISYQKLSFDYISFCKHLNLNEIRSV